jgi:hypothetical protein
LERRKLHPVGALSLMILEDGPLFIADTHVHAQPSPEQIAETVIATARHVKRFGVEPNIALCSGSQFGNLDSDSGRRMRAALEILEMQECGFAYEGEMHVDSALDPELRARIFPNSRFQGTANALVFASTDAAGAARNILKMKGKRAGGRADPDGDGQPRAYRDARDHGAWSSEHLGARRNAGQPLRIAGRLSRAEGDSARRGSKPYLPGLPPPAAFFGAGFLSPMAIPHLSSWGAAGHHAPPTHQNLSARGASRASARNAVSTDVMTGRRGSARTAYSGIGPISPTSRVRREPSARPSLSDRSRPVISGRPHPGSS